MKEIQRTAIYGILLFAIIILNSFTVYTKPVFTSTAKVDIVVAANATVQETKAAGQLCKYLKSIYPSCQFTVTPAINKNNTRIKIGVTGSFSSGEELSGKIPAHDEGFLIQQAGKDEVVIASRSSKGLFNAVYSLLEKLGCGFYLSHETIPVKQTGIRFKDWEMSETPLQNERIVFNWHNFLSGCTGWNYEDWCSWIDQSAKMRFNTIMVHAYGNNPMFSFEYNGLKKEVGYLTTSVSGRDWGAQHINDVRKLPGGKIFDEPVFGSRAAKVPGEQRIEAATQLMAGVFKYADEMAMKINFAIDVDTWSANPRNIIESLPAGCRIKLKTQDVVNPETEDGYQYYKAQVRTLLGNYPHVSAITVWVRSGSTLWRDITPEQFPAVWQEEWSKLLSENPELKNDNLAASNFAFSKIVRAFQKAVTELNRSDVIIAFGSWNWHFLPSATIVMPENCQLIPLDYSINFDSDKTREILSKAGKVRKLIPIVWAQHDDHRYMGKPYTPYPGFNTLLNERNAAGFGIIHWTTRPLDLFFKSLADQVWSGSENKGIDEVIAGYRQKVFGSRQPVIEEYLKEWLIEGPMFGRETSTHFFDLGKQPGRFEPYAVSIEKVKKRMMLLKQVKVSDLSETGKKNLQYCMGMEDYYLSLFENQDKFTRAYAMLERQQNDSARAILTQVNPENTIEIYARASNFLPITTGEKAMIVSMGTRWLPDFINLKQRARLEGIRYRFAETLHDPLAQWPGTDTWFIDNKNVFWACLGIEELKKGKLGQVPETQAKDLPDYAQKYLEIEQPLVFPLTTIGKNNLAPGKYKIDVSCLGNSIQDCNLFLVNRNTRTPLQTVRTLKTKPALLTSVVEIKETETYSLEIKPGGGGLKLTNLVITPVQE